MFWNITIVKNVRKSRRIYGKQGKLIGSFIVINWEFKNILQIILEMKERK